MAAIPLIFIINPLIDIFALPASSSSGLRQGDALLYLLGIPCQRPARWTGSLPAVRRLRRLRRNVSVPPEGAYTKITLQKRGSRAAAAPRLLDRRERESPCESVRAPATGRVDRAMALQPYHGLWVDTRSRSVEPPAPTTAVERAAAPGELRRAGPRRVGWPWLIVGVGLGLAFSVLRPRPVGIAMTAAPLLAFTLAPRSTALGIALGLGAFMLLLALFIAIGTVLHARQDQDRVRRLAGRIPRQQLSVHR